MKKYFALYMAPSEELQKLMATMTPEQAKKGMDEWAGWQRQHTDQIVEMGNPLGKNKRVNKSGVSDVRNDVTGYTIVQANSHDEAAKLFLDNPHFQLSGAYVEVLEIVEMPAS